MNLQSILYAVIFILIYFNELIAERNPELVISQSGVDAVAPCGIGLKFFIELNNTSDKHDYEVQVSADQCCLEADGSLDCDVLEILGDCVGFIPRSAIKTVRMVAPILDPLERRGYCILYLDSKCHYNGRNMRDTVKINFNTKNGNVNKIFDGNIKPCKNKDEDPLNDCKPVDCDSYYNNQKPHFSGKLKKCVEAPPCISDTFLELPNTIYDPVSNRCVEGKSIKKRDIDFIKQLNTNNRRAKDVLIIEKVNDNFVDNFTNNALNEALDKVPTCPKCNNLHILNPPATIQVGKKCCSNFVMDYIKANEYTLIVFGGVVFIQCCLIIGMVYCLTKTCACCKKKNVVRKFFNYRQDACVTTPLIGTSNMDTETDYQFESESSKLDKKIKCYKACEKERNNNMKMSDDILTKCLNRRNWSSQKNKNDAAGEPIETQRNIDNVGGNNVSEPVAEFKEPAETKIIFEDEKPKASEKMSKKFESIPRCLNKEIIAREREEIETYESSEREIQCHSYNNDSVNTTGFKPSSVIKNLGYFKTNKNGPVSVSTDKGAQAYFSNDSIDDLITERGMCIVENISKFSLANESIPTKTSTPTPVSSKTSKNNIVKNILSFMHKKKANTSSDPGTKSKDNLDIKLIHMSRASIYSTSNDSECIKCIKAKNSRTSL